VRVQPDVVRARNAERDQLVGLRRGADEHLEAIQLKPPRARGRRLLLPGSPLLLALLLGAEQPGRGQLRPQSAELLGCSAHLHQGAEIRQVGQLQLCRLDQPRQRSARVARLLVLLEQPLRLLQRWHCRIQWILHPVEGECGLPWAQGGEGGEQGIAGLEQRCGIGQRRLRLAQRAQASRDAAVSAGAKARSTASLGLATGSMCASARCVSRYGANCTTWPSRSATQGLQTCLSSPSVSAHTAAATASQSWTAASGVLADPVARKATSRQASGLKPARLPPRSCARVGTLASSARSASRSASRG